MRAQMSQLIISSYPSIQMLGVTERDFMGQMGEYFVDFVGQYGYDRVLSVLGRHMRDFLNGKRQILLFLQMYSFPST